MLAKDIRDALLHFRAERDWKQFHTPRSLAISLSLEANEVLELFQWEDRQGEQLAEILPALRDELADVAAYLTYLCEDLGIDLDEAVRYKMMKNQQKYPVSLARGSAKKYTEL